MSIYRRKRHILQSFTFYIFNFNLYEIGSAELAFYMNGQNNYNLWRMYCGKKSKIKDYPAGWP